MDFKLKGEYVELIKLLKAVGWAGTGGEAKWLVDEGQVQVNGEVESRKRKKLIPGDHVVFGQEEIFIRS